VVELYPATIRLILTAYTDVGDLIEAITPVWFINMSPNLATPGPQNDYPARRRSLLGRRIKTHVNRRIAQKKSSAGQPEQGTQRVDELKTRFMSVASHELRTPLAIISGSIELLSMMMENLNEKQTHLVRNAMEGTTRLNDIISSVFDLVKIDSDKMMLTFQAFDCKNSSRMY
jgi:signal transduction histidine kinase